MYEIEEKIVKVGERGQVTIPKRIRRLVDLQPKSKLRVLLLPDKSIVLKKVEEESPEDKLVRLLNSVSSSIDVEKIWKEIEDEREEDR